MTEPPTSDLPAAASRYLETGVAGIEGWLSSTTALVVARILAWQAVAGIRGDVCEIGVHHGKLFLVLATSVAAGERAVAVDVFSDQHENADRSGSGDRATLEQNLATYAPDADVEVIQQSSLGLAAGGFLARRFRFVSIDGGHTAHVTANDLRLAERTLVPGGVAALDDILSWSWTGVLTGLVAYLAEGGTMLPFAMAPNKLLLTTDGASAAQAGAALRRAFPAALAKTELEFPGGLVDAYKDHPLYDLDALARLRLENDERRAEVAALEARLKLAAEERASLRGDLQHAAALRSVTQAEAEALRARLESAAGDLSALRSSTSWRLTGPIRAVASLARKAR